MAATIPPSQYDPETGSIRVDAREASDLYDLLRGLEVACTPPTEAEGDTSGLRTIALTGNPDAAEIRRVVALIDVYNGHRRTRAASGGAQ